MVVAQIASQNGSSAPRRDVTVKVPLSLGVTREVLAKICETFGLHVWEGTLLEGERQVFLCDLVDGELSRELVGKINGQLKGPGGEIKFVGPGLYGAIAAHYRSSDVLVHLAERVSLLVEPEKKPLYGKALYR